MELDTAKGTRDIPPSEQQAREAIVATLTHVFKSYGFVPLDTPLLERRDVLAAKFAAGEDSDALKETYRLKDQGERELGLRFDLTVPLCRYVGMNRTMKLPFKRYQIGKVYRDAPVKAGRYREFTQVDADIIGSDSLFTDITCLRMALDAYTKLDMDITLRINNRRFLQDLLASYGIDDKKFPSVVIAIDKLDKIGKNGVAKELEQLTVAQDTITKLLDELSMSGNNEEKLQYFINKMCADESLDELKKIIDILADARVVFDPTLVRGLGYYTGTVFEVYDNTGTLDSSLGSGGRYDKIIGDYLETAGVTRDREYPAMGVSFGLDRIFIVLEKTGKLPKQAVTTQVFIVPLGTDEAAFAVATQLRASGLAVDMDLMDRGISKNLNNCNKEGIAFALIIGEDEVAQGKYTLKDLRSGTEEKLSVQEIVRRVQS